MKRMSLSYVMLASASLRSNRLIVSSSSFTMYGRIAASRKKTKFQREFRLLSAVPGDTLMEDFAISLRNAHENRGIDEVIQMTSPQGRCGAIFAQLSTEALLQAAINASSSDSGRINTGTCASIVNSLVASSHNDVERCIQFLDLLTDEAAPIQPDLVTLSCIISSIQITGGNNYQVEAERAIDICRKMSKKKAGGARRRELAAARRKRNQGSTNYAIKLKEKFNIDILYEDDDFIGVTKPAGMLCYAVKSKKRQRDVTLEDALSSMGTISLSTINPEGRGIVHRLDRGASGALVVAKNDFAHACLVAEFFRRNISKSYLALSSGIIVPPSGSIDAYVDNKPAISHYSTINTYDCDASLIKVQTKTGRKHQVRSHLTQMGAPIFLDPLFYSKDPGYGTSAPDSVQKLSESFVKNKESPHSYKFFLHCSSLKIPRFGIDLKSKTPEWWSQVIDALPLSESLTESISEDLSAVLGNNNIKDKRELEGYEKMTVTDLKTKCKELNISGYSGKKKQEIISLILESTSS